MGNALLFVLWVILGFMLATCFSLYADGLPGLLVGMVTVLVTYAWSMQRWDAE